MTFPLVLVRWHDAWFDNDPPATGYHTTFPVQTVGWLIHQDEQRTSVASEVLPHDEGFRAITHIPESSIIDITDLVPRPP